MNKSGDGLIYATKTENKPVRRSLQVHKNVNENAAEYYDVQVILWQQCGPETKYL